MRNDAAQLVSFIIPIQYAAPLIEQAGAKPVQNGSCTEVPRAVPVEGVGLSALGSPELCAAALDTSKTNWSTGEASRADVKEAELRSLTIDNCRTALGLLPLSDQKSSVLSTEALCSAALNVRRTEFERAGDHAELAKEVDGRGLTVDACRAALGLKTLAK